MCKQSYQSTMDDILSTNNPLKGLSTDSTSQLRYNASNSTSSPRYSMPSNSASSSIADRVVASLFYEAPDLGMYTFNQPRPGYVGVNDMATSSDQRDLNYMRNL